jgi:hypothetical protein
MLEVPPPVRVFREPVIAPGGIRRLVLLAATIALLQILYSAATRLLGWVASYLWP